MDLIKYILDFLNNNPGKAIGALLGFIISILILSYGLLKTALIILFVILGILIGKILDDKISVIDEIKNIFRRK